jgi:hypothetical protein
VFVRQAGFLAETYEPERRIGIDNMLITNIFESQLTAWKEQHDVAQAQRARNVTGRSSPQNKRALLTLTEAGLSDTSVLRVMRYQRARVTLSVFRQAVCPSIFL